MSEINDTPELKKFTEGYALKAHYSFDCVLCGHNQNLNPSIMMGMGYNTGAGSCGKCGEHLHLEIDEEKGIAVSEKMEDYGRRLVAGEIRKIEKS